MKLVSILVGVVLLLGGYATISAHPTGWSPSATAAPVARATPVFAPEVTLSATAVGAGGIARADAVHEALAAVSVAIPSGRPVKYQVSSGSLVDPSGLVLTSYHVVRDPGTGEPYNREDLIYVSVNRTTDEAPDRIFRAQVAAYDELLDLAVLRLTATREGVTLAEKLNLWAIPLGDSDEVEVGEPIQVLGYPELGGDTVTVSEGIVSGFLEGRMWIKTDTSIGLGNSGGMAINAVGELIGVPTQVVINARSCTQIGLMRPVNLAKPLIMRARVETMPSDVSAETK